MSPRPSPSPNPSSAPAISISKRPTEGFGEGLGRGDILAVSKGLEGFAQFLNLVAGIALLIQSFKVRRMLTEHLASLGQPRPISGVATFFFQILYLQHKINQVLARSTGAGSR